MNGAATTTAPGNVALLPLVAASPLRIKITIGGMQFDAEGDAAVISEQLTRFYSVAMQISVGIAAGEAMGRAAAEQHQNAKAN